MELAGLVPSKASLLGLQVVSSPHVLMWSSLYVCVCVLTASSYKDTGHIGLGFPGGSVVRNPPANARDVTSISGSGRSPGVANGNPLQYSCLENSLERGAWQATVHGVEKSQTQLSMAQAQRKASGV